LEGWVGENAYLQLWSSEEVPELNAGYCVDEFMPGVILIGSNGGGTAIGIDGRSTAREDARYLAVPYLPMSWEEVICRYPTLVELLTAAEYG